MVIVIDAIGNPKFAVAAAPDPVVSPVPFVNDTVGAEPCAYPFPNVDTVIVSNWNPKIGSAVAGVVLVPVKVIEGAVTYPLPLLVIVMDVTASPVRVAVPVAVIPVKVWVSPGVDAAVRLIADPPEVAANLKESVVEFTM